MPSVQPVSWLGVPVHACFHLLLPALGSEATGQHTHVELRTVAGTAPASQPSARSLTGDSGMVDPDSLTFGRMPQVAGRMYEKNAASYFDGSCCVKNNAAIGFVCMVSIAVRADVVWSFRSPGFQQSEPVSFGPWRVSSPAFC